MSKEELDKALKIFDREDLTYENDEFCNDFEEYMNIMKQEKAIEVFMSTEDMIKYSKLEDEIERLKSIIKEVREWANKTIFYFDFEEEITKHAFDLLYTKQGQELLEILDKENKND